MNYVLTFLSALCLSILAVNLIPIAHHRSYISLNHYSDRLLVNKSIADDLSANESIV
jgi:hypothetical protein